MEGETMKDQPKTLGAYIARARMEMECRYPQVDDELCATALDAIDEFENELVKLIRFDSPVIEREDGPTLVVTEGAVEQAAMADFGFRANVGDPLWEDAGSFWRESSRERVRAVLAAMNVEVARWVGRYASSEFYDVILDDDRIAVLRPKEGE